MIFGAVLSYHLNPLTCGVSKFNHALARRMGLPLYDVRSHDGRHALLSVKFGEMREPLPIPRSPYAVFLHDTPALSHEWDLVLRADMVYTGSASILAAVQSRRPDAVSAHCPSTVDGNADRGGYRVLTFGMAHKLVLPHFQKLKDELERDHPDYTLSLSTAVHEGSPWDEALTTSVEAMRGIFGNRLRVLGFLADDALARELAECDAVAAFFVPALRANNTSAWAALSAGKFLYTNLDAQSPALDPQQYGWDALIEKLNA